MKKQSRIRVRDAEDYENAVLPSFEVDYADKDPMKLEMIRRNPMVPIGAGVTALVLAGGLMAFNRGSQVWSQRLMRARVVAQGCTLGILALSVNQIRAAASDDKPPA